MARLDIKKDYVISTKNNFGGRLGKQTISKDTSFGGKLAYIGGSTVAGLAGVFEGIGKTFGTIGAKFAGDERLARYYARKSTVGEWQSDLAEKYSPDAITRFLGDAGAGVGQSSVFLLNLAVPGAGWATFGTGIYGNALGSAVEKTGELGFREFTYAGLSTAGEMLAEKISGATMKAVGRIGGSVSGSLTKNAVESAATAGAKKGFIKAVASNAVLKDLLKESSSEFVEEFLGDFYDVGISRLTGVDPEASTTITSALYSGLVGFVSGGFMSGTSIIVNRAAAASRGYSIIESGNADTMVRTAKTIVEEASQAELFKDPSGYVDALRQSVSEYEGAKDKTGYGARVSLGMMQMLTAYVDKNIGLAKTKLKIANADAASLEQMASVLSYYSGEKVTAEDIRTNKDGAADRLAIMDWVNGVLTVDMDELNEAVIRDTMSGKKTVSGIAESEFDVSGGAKTVSMPDGSYLSYRKNAEGTYDYTINDGASAENGEDGVWTAKSVSEEEMRNIYESVRQKAQAYQAEAEKQKTEQAQNADAEKADGSEKAEKHKPEKKERKRVEISSSAAEKAGKYVRSFSSLSFRDRLAIARMIESAEKYGVDEKTVKGIACMMSVRSGLEIRFSKALGESGMWSALKGERRLIAVNPELTDAIGRTVSHELIHDMMSDGKEARDSLVEITKEYAGEDQFSAYKESRREAYFKAMKKAGAVHGEAVETVSADGKKSMEYRFESKADEAYFEDVMTEEAVAYFGSVYLQERDFLDRYGSRFAGPLKRAWNRIRNWISLVRAKDRDAAIAMESYTQTISKYLSDTYGVETMKVAMGIETDSGKESGTSETRYSFSSIANSFFGDENMTTSEFEKMDYRETQGYKDYVEQCLNNYRQTRTDFDENKARKEIGRSINGIVRVAVAMKKAGYDIYDSAAKRTKTDSKNRLLFSSLEPNSDYFTSSDISTICDKRKNFAEIYDDIVREEESKGVPQGKRFFDNVDNYFYIHKLLADKGLTQPCRECYVESMRKNLAPMASSFLRLIRETDVNNKSNDQLYEQKGKKKGSLKTNNSALRERVLSVLTEYGMTAESLTVQTLTTADGLAKLKLEAPFVYEAFNSFYGQSKPKMPKEATPFRFGELTALLTDENGKIKRSLVERINSTGGFRLQSYSDFQIQNYVDVLQVLFEAGTLGLRGHAYTKVPAFLDATEGTNLKRNISIFMYKDGNEWKIDRNDSFPYALDDIYKIVESDKTGNTGIIAVSQNEEMSAWIMANDKVGFGIPFHKSGLKMATVRDTIVKEEGREIKGYSGTKDHTRQQTEVWAKSTQDHKALTKVSKPISIYDFWDFDNKSGLSKNALIRKNLKAYIDACNEAGYLPRFREYVINNQKVLSDVLKYAKSMGFVSQDATVSDIAFKYKGYTIPYGYYKFLGDFGMFTPDGKASPHKVLSLDHYDFEKAVKFFSDSETLRRNEILQQFANGEERKKYRDSNLTAEELEKIVRMKRDEVVREVVGEGAKNTRFSIQIGDEGVSTKGRYRFETDSETILRDISEQNDIERFLPEGLSKDFIKAIRRSNGFAPPRLYRGMEAAELDYIIENGFIKSNSSYNFTNQQGQTRFSSQIQTALSYATSFAPTGIREKFFEQGLPAYIVEVGNYSDLNFVNEDSIESYTKKEVDTKYITRVIELTYDADAKKVKARDIEINGMNQAKGEPIHGVPSFVRDKVTGTILYEHQDAEGYEDGKYISEKNPGVLFDFDMVESHKGSNFDYNSYLGISGDPKNLVPYKFEGSQDIEKRNQNRKHGEIRFELSRKDSDGNSLSAGQQDYFKDSKIRDDDGNLLVVYHGTSENFTVFDRTKSRANMDIQGSFFSPWDIDAGGYGGNVGAYYLNIKNPASESMGYKALNKFQGQNNAGVKAREYLESLGYDGVNNGGEEYIAFRSDQIKRIDNKNPTSDPDVRYELDAKDGYSRGQMAKIVANRTKQKVYERKDAIYAIDRAADVITDYYSDAYGVRRARLRGKSRDEVIDYLFEQMNKEQGDGRLQTAVTAAEYIVNHAIIQNELDSVAADDYARLIDIVNGLDGFRKKVKLTETEIGDIRHIYDKKASAVLRSWYGENGFLPSQILTELRDSGVIVNSDSDVESDIFSDLLTAYDNAKESIAKWNEKILLSSMASKEEVKAFKNSIAHEILRAFDETGEKSAYRKEIEARQKYISDTIAKYNQKLKAARRRAMAEARLFRDAMELENLIKRDRQLHSFFQDERVKKLSESAARIGKPRNARNPSTVREWAKAMLEVYNPKNELMQIDGEMDTYADPVVVEALERLSQIEENVYRNGEKRKNKYLTDEQVIDLQTAVSGLKRLYREYDTVFLNGKRVSLTDTAQKGIDNFKWILERNEKKGKRFTFLEKSALFGKDYIYEIASPLSVIADMEFHDPNGVLTQAYENIVYGQMKSQVQLAMLSEPFEKFYKENKGYRKKLAREYVHYKDVKLTKAQAVSLYCTMKREQAKLGLETFGIKYVNENGKEVESGKFTTVDPDILWNQFDSTDRKFVETVENFFNEVSKKVKSEADMRIIGSTNVLQDYYFPISRDPIQKISNMTDMRGMLDALQTVVRMSFNQNTVKHADGRLYISDVTAVLDRHMAGLAVYSNLYEELQAFNRIYNKNVTPSDALGNPIRSQMKSVREMLESTYKGANKYLNKLMADIQGVRIGEEGKFEPILNRFTGLFAQAAISGNIKTVLLPLASYPAAGLHIDAKYLMQALAMHASKKAIRENIEQMDKYSSVTKGRYMERGAIRAQTVQSEVKGLIEYTGKGIEATERFMVSKIWNAAKLQTAAESGLAVDSDENCKLAAKLLDKTIIETQAQYVSSMKSAMARSHNPLVRGFTMFKSDAAAMFSYNFDAFRKYQHLKERADAGQDVKAELDEAKKKLPRAIGSMAASCVSFAIITQLVRYALNQDDDDEETPVKNIAMNTLNSMVSMFPVVADVYEFFVDGYEMSNFALDGVNDALKSVKNIIDLIGQKNVTNADIARTVRSALYSFGTLAGIPVRNTVNLATGVIRRFSKPTMYAYDSIFSGEQYAKDLAKAVERGDMKMAQAVIKVMYEREKAGAYDEKTLNEVLRLYEAGYENVIPDSVRSSVTVNGTVIDLSSDQLEQFKKIYAEADSTIQAMMQGDAYNGFSDEQKAYAIRSVYNSYKRYAAYSATGQTDSLTGIMMELLGSEKCATARSYISGLKSDKDQKPENGWKETIRKELKKQGLSQSEIAIVLYASGYRGEEETEALIKALNAKKYSAEKLQMIAKILNLTVKNGKLVNEKPKAA